MVLDIEIIFEENFKILGVASKLLMTLSDEYESKTTLAKSSVNNLLT